ncbi:MAG: GlsB/YeaQ/YmgE family stress response membrane protein [Candidatus Dormibacteraeota bacterium]|nr:GlsB/YeaQ/YmgE family stress response membrane protein [Candidatus Dormibacteraeota bacterium]
MSIISWIIVGLVAGVIAKLLMPGRDPGGCVITMLIGIAGALLGGWLVGLFVGGNPVTGFNLTTLLVAILGALILLMLYRIVFGSRARVGR